MGTRGPVPKRSEDRIRRNKDENGPVEKLHAIGPVEIPDLGLEDPDPIVVDFYESLKQSTQTKYYEPSDWWLARFAAREMDGYLKGEKKSAMMLQTVLSMTTDLMITESDRRRLRIEIERNNEDAQIFDLSDRIKEMLDRGSAAG